MWIKIIKQKTWDKMQDKLQTFHKQWQDMMREYENLHRLHDGLWERYKNELTARDQRIYDLEAQLRKAEHQRNEYKNKLEKYESRRK